jgi:hypothetical protein
VWPHYRSYAVAPPPPFADAAAEFAAFYTAQCLRAPSAPRESAARPRQLSWLFGLGAAELSMRRAPPLPPLRVVASTLQAMVLALFGEGDEALTVREVAARLRVDAALAKALAHSLSCGRLPPLAKSPPAAAVALDDVLRPNAELKLPEEASTLLLPPPELDRAPRAPRRRNRAVVIDACIVRLLKRARAQTQQQVVEHVARTLAHWKVPEKDVLARLAALVEAEYLERDGALGFKYVP